MSDAPVPELRVTDTDRDLVTALLRSAVGEGAITLHEFEERVDATVASRTRGDLERVTADLPAHLRSRGLEAGDQPPAPPRSARRRIVAVLSEERTSRRWRPADRTQAIAFMGSAEVDLTVADIPADLVIDATAVMGQVAITVPPDVDVGLRGFAFMGQRDDRSGDAPPGSPCITINARAVMGQVEIVRGERGSGSVPSGTTGAVERADQPPERHRGHDLSHPRRGRGWIAPLAIVAAVGAGIGTGYLPPDAFSLFGSSVEQVRVADGEEAVVSSFAMFGSTEVVVPSDVSVDVSGLALFGSAECDTCSTTPAPDAGHVEVRHFTLFGSLEVIRSDATG